jgi:hypothetical protein
MCIPSGIMSERSFKTFRPAAPAPERKPKENGFFGGKLSLYERKKSQGNVSRPPIVRKDDIGV